MSETEGAATVVVGSLSQGELDAAELRRFGKILDKRPVSLSGRTVGMALDAYLLAVRTRTGSVGRLRANVAQRLFERRRGQSNIVLKARQLGVTKWSAARFLLKTMTQPGTLTMEVAHTQEAAEALFRSVHR